MYEKKYKTSTFNYCVEKGSQYLIYNTLYNTLVRLNESEFLTYSGKTISNVELVEEFVKNGLWVDEKLDEKRCYLACAKAYTLHMPRPLSITITTTLKCNARCVYCYEKGVKQIDIFSGAEDKIVEFIKANMIQNEVQILWFGGEPLMNMKFMDSLSHRLNKEGIRFSSYIITNGSKINDLILNEKLALWNVHDMQITLDGTKKSYESRKRYINRDEGEFYGILHNIKKLAEKGIFINIRLNIDRDNKADILDLLKEIDGIFSSFENVVFYPAFITGARSPMTEEEKVECVKEMLNCLINIKKLTAGTKFYSFPRMHACMNGDPRSFTIDVEGNVYTCEHYVGKAEYAIGNISDNRLKKDFRGEKLEFREECKECVFLPKCFGGCEANYLEGDSPCMIEKYIIKAYLELL